jgi:hypothetical protein
MKGFCLLMLVFCQGPFLSVYSQQKALIETGVARIDITPETPIRLTGYSSRHVPFEGVSQKLWAKALAFGDDDNLSILITVDLLGIPHSITEKVRQELAMVLDLDPAQLSICASHTHSGPQIGNILSHFHKPLSPDELADVALYALDLVPKLKDVSLDAVKDRKPAYVLWGRGEVDFAINRRTSINPNGVVDHALPVLQVKSPSGELRAILANYACHAVTFGPENNTVHGDWVGEAQVQMEADHPGAIAMVSIGCGADQDSNPRMNRDDPAKNFEYIEQQGRSIADEVKRMLMSDQEWSRLTAAPKGKMEYIDLEFADLPDPLELAIDAKSKGRSSNYAHLLLSRMARSERIPMEIKYPVQAWNFGEDFTMVFLAGEVVVDYSLRLKRELGEERVWINAYANDMPCYIASRRIIDEGGYESLGSMKGYEKPSELKHDVEEKIINSIYGLLPDSLNKGEINLGAGSDGTISLSALVGTGIGPNIAYMPEWQAYGWFTSEDRVEWKFTVEKAGKYAVELEWSVSDKEAGNRFIFDVNGKEVKGVVGKSGSWETFIVKMIGELTLEDGSQKAVFKTGSNSGIKEALLDLRRISLIPIVD